MPLPDIRTQIQQHGKQLETSLGLDASSARIEVSMLLCHALGKVNRAWLITHENNTISPEQSAVFREMLQRRLAGEPMAYLLGEREFHGLKLKITPAVLVPRPETEMLVELALQCLPPQGRLLDLGTGSGAIALAIAHARPDVKVTAVDASHAALEVAKQNVLLLELGNVHLLHSVWFSALPGERFDVIVANPPYVADNDPHLQQGDLRFEPVSALTSGADGLDDIRDIIAKAPAHLNPGGWLLLEHGYDQAAKARTLLQQSGLNEIFSAHDLAGIERISGGNWLKRQDKL